MSSLSPFSEVQTHRRLEWIYLVYLGFFALAVMSPSLVSHGLWGLSQQLIEEIAIFLFGLAGILTFSAYERLMERREVERDEAIESAGRAKQELIESYTYIGSVNRQIELLKKFVRQTSLNLTDAHAYWKNLLQSLAANTGAAVDADSVLIRFVDIHRLRTDREIAWGEATKRAPKIGNKELKQIHDNSATHAYVTSEDGKTYLVIPSDRKDSPMQAFFLIAAEPKRITDVDVSLMKVFANQAELIHHILLGKSSAEMPLNSIDRMTPVDADEVG